MNISKQIKDKRGITLIELILVVSLLVMVLGSVAVFTRPMRGLFAMNQASVELKEQSNVVFEVISNKLRKTSSIEIQNYKNESSMSDATKSYLYTKSGSVYYKKKTNATKVLIDASLYQPYHLHLRYQPSDTKNKGVVGFRPITLNVKLWFLTDAGSIVYERNSGFEILNMMLKNAELINSGLADESYVQVIIFTEE